MSDFNQEKVFSLKINNNTSSNLFTRYDGTIIPESISHDQYITDCKKIIEKIKHSHFDKVVLSRVVPFQLSRSLESIFNDLCEKYHSAFVYMISINGFGTWIGASPETFLEFKKNIISTTALAGTKIKKETPWGLKEIEEQDIVSCFIEKELNLFSESEVSKNGPYTINTGSVFHLKTDFSCQIQNSKITQVMRNLHPTPATCGLPQKDTQVYISTIEKHQRSLYTGFLGPTSETNGHFFVNLRCMEVIGETAYLYVGGGITADSDPELEWQETINKMKTLSPFLN